MTEENTKRQQSRRRTVLRVLLYGSVLAIAILVASHFVWKYSGSNQWELVSEQDGIKVYSRKVPGLAQKDFKGVRRAKLTLNSVVASFASTETEACAEWYRGCVSAQTIQPWNSQDMSYVNLWRMPMPAPFSPREVLVKEQISQDPQSKVVLVQFHARPNDLPRNECCFRVPVWDNSWRLTPLGTGEIEIEFIMHADGGFPYPMINRRMPVAIYKMFSRMPKLFSQEKWQHTKFDRIKEM